MNAPRRLRLDVTDVKGHPFATTSWSTSRLEVVPERRSAVHRLLGTVMVCRWTARRCARC